MTEKRQHPRYAIELDAEMTVDSAALTGRTQDISKGGFCMLTQEPVPVPATGEVRLALVFSETEFSEHLTLPATTVWCTPLKNGYQVGVKFAKLDAHDRAYLDLFIRFLDGGDEDEDEDEDEEDDDEDTTE